MAYQRLEQINNHLIGKKSATKIGAKSPDDVVIVAALRSPITRSKNGGLKDTHIEDMLSAVFKALIEKTKINPELIQDIVIGNVLTGTAATMARMASLHAGIPDRVPIYSLNRQCSSGLQAVANIASSIQSGLIDVGIGAGVESMNMHYGPQAQPTSVSDKIQSCEAAADCLIPMGEKQDNMAADSHRKAVEAQEKGIFNEEIVPFKATICDKDGDEKEIIITKDDGIRKGVTTDSLKKLKPAFDENGFTTAGNASQISDGAAGVLLMRRSKAQELGIKIIGKYITSAIVGVPPRILGVGPAYAIPAALKKADIQLNNVDIFEINEAFASQTIYCVEKLGINMKKVNPNGGAIALGHPLGCTGARQIATLLPELKRQGKKIGCISMCIGTGMGMASIFEVE